MKRRITVLLGLILLVLVFTGTAVASSGTCGTNVTWTLSNDGVLTISGSGAMKNYLYYSPAPWYSQRSDIQSVVISENVTSIGNYAFYYCDNLTSITIPNSVTSIGSYAFDECTSLTSVTIPNSVTSIGGGAFAGCTSLASVTIPNSVTSIGYEAFCGCTSLTSVAIPDSVTSIGKWAFVDCESLSSVTIHNSVTSIGYEAFQGCTSLNAIYVDSLEQWLGYDHGSSCLYLHSNNGKLYVAGKELTNAVIPSGVTSIGDLAFYGCTSLTSVTLPDSVTSIGGSAFENCTSLTSVTIPNSVMSIGSSAFYYCNLNAIYVDSLEQWLGYDHGSSCLYLHSNNGKLYVAGKELTDAVIPSGVTSIGDLAFYGCTSLTSVTIPDSVTSIDDCAFYNCTKLSSVTIPGSVTYIGAEAFCKCNSLLKVTYSGTLEQAVRLFETPENDNLKNTNWVFPNFELPTYFGTCGYDVIWTLSDEGVLTISGSDEMTDYSYDSHAPWYSQSSSIQSVIISKNVTSIGNYAFYHCDSLTSVTIPNSVTSIGSNAFYDCTSLTIVTIPNSVRTIGNYAFAGCTSLTSITIPNSVKSIGYMAFGSCSSLNAIYVDSLEQWLGYYHDSSGLCRYGDNTKLYVAGKELTNAVIPSGVTSIGDYAFAGCTSLTSVTIPNSVTSIGWFAFRGCTSLTSITIPNSVTSIYGSAFRGCTSLTSVTIPDSVTSIFNAVFYGCSSLKSVFCPSRIARSKMQIGDNNSALTNAKWHYGPGSCGDTLTWYVDEAAGILYITGTGAMEHYTTSLQPWDCSAFTKVNLADGVTALGDYAFYGAELTEIYLPESLESFGTDVFSSSPLVYCYEYSNADFWADSRNLQTVYLDSAPAENYLTVTLSGDSTIYRTCTARLTAKVFPQAAGFTVLWTSSEEAVAKVDQSGLVTALSRGTAVITANVNGITASHTVTVTGFQDVGTLAILNAPERLQVGSSAALTAVPTPADSALTYRWSSSDSQVLKVSESGKITAVAPGTAIVTVTAEGITASKTVYVYQPITSLTMAEEVWGVSKETVSLSRHFTPEDANPVFSWTSSDESKAKITDPELGVVSCYVPGDVTITLTDAVTGISAQTVLHVVTPVRTITMPETMTLSIGQTAGNTLEATVVTTRGVELKNRLVTFTSDRPDIAEISSQGVITPRACGTAVITVSASSGVQAQCTVTVESGSHRYLHGVCTNCGAISEKIRTLRLPAGLTAVDENAFRGVAAERIIIPQDVKQISAGAFADCTSLRVLVFEGDPETLANGILSGCTDVIIQAAEGSSAARWAAALGYTVVYI